MQLSKISRPPRGQRVAHATFDERHKLRIEHRTGNVPSERIGGADRDRTDDLRLAKPALSQLSYSP